MLRARSQLLESGNARHRRSAGQAYRAPPREILSAKRRIGSRGGGTLLARLPRTPDTVCLGACGLLHRRQLSRSRAVAVRRQDRLTAAPSPGAAPCHAEGRAVILTCGNYPVFRGTMPRSSSSQRSSPQGDGGRSLRTAVSSPRTPLRNRMPPAPSQPQGRGAGKRCQTPPALIQRLGLRQPPRVGTEGTSPLTGPTMRPAKALPQPAVRRAAALR